MRPAESKRLVATALLAAACSSVNPGPVADQVVVTPTAVSVAPGATQQLSVTVLDRNGEPISAAPVTYTSGDVSIATVGSTGLVQGVAPGFTTITVRSNPAANTIPVTISAPNPGAGELILTPDTAFLQASQTLQLDAVVYDTLGNPMPGALVQYLSRDPSVVTVSSTGLVSRSGVGTTWVRATSGAARDSVLITAVVARVAVDGMPFGAVVSSSGVAYVTRALRDSVARLNLPSPSVVAGFAVGAFPTSVAFNQAGTRAYVANQFGQTVTAVNTGTNAVLGSVPIAGTPAAVAVAAGDAVLLVGTDAGKLYFVSLPALTVTDSVNVPSYTNSIAISGTTAYANSVGAGTITRINVATRQVTGTLTVGGVVQGLAVSSDGSELYVANEIGQVEIRNAATGALSELLQHEIDHLNGILAIDRAIDSRHIVLRSEFEKPDRQHSIAL